MSDPSTLVTNAFDNAKTYTDEAMALVTSFLDSFAANLYTAPLVDVVWTGVDAPAVEAIPAVPTFDTPTFTMPTAPTALTEAAPTITIDDFTEVAPAVDTSGKPVLDFGAKPVISIGAVPDVYSPGEIVMPTAPADPVMPDLPVMLSLTTPTFAGFDPHTAFLTDTEAALPTLSLVDPTPYSYTPGAAYTSALKTAISSLLLTRSAGGTGLDPAVEAAIWGRASDRESANTDAAITQALEANEALGWSIPTGATSAAVRRARQNARNRSGDLSREVAIKQADLEQENIQKTLDQGIQWEGSLINYSLELERITFESARVTAENAIAVHNAGLEQFKSLLQLVNTRIALYDSIIKGELANIDVYKAELQAEQTKAEVNSALVKQYEAEIEARMALVKFYSVKLDAAKVLVEVEKAKVEASGEAIKGFVASVNAKTAEVEVYKAGVQAEQSKIEAWRTDIQGQLGVVQAYTAKADAFRAKSGAQAEKARAELARWTGLTQAKEAEYRGYTAQVEAERARVLATGDVARALLAAYEANVRAVEVKANQNARLFEARIKEYEAQATYTLNGQKINSDIIAHNRQVALDAAKAGAQILAQIAGSAMSQAHATASVDGRSGTTVSYQYTNNTDSAPVSITTA